MKIGYIYLITNKVNGKQYIGSTLTSVQQRWRQHISAARNGHHLVLSKAIRKYTPDKFTVETLFCTKNLNELHIIENEFMEKYNTLKKGYNMVPAAFTRPIVQECMKKEWANPAIRKRRLSAMRIGSTHRFKSIIRVHVYDGSFQIYANVNDAKRDGYSTFGIYDSLQNPGRKGQNNLWFYYTDNDPQDYVKQAETLLGRFKTEYSNPVKMEHIKTGKIIILDNVGKVSEYNLEVKRVMKCLKGQRQSCGGYRFSYIPI